PAFSATQGPVQPRRAAQKNAAPAAVEPPGTDRAESVAVANVLNLMACLQSRTVPRRGPGPRGGTQPFQQIMTACGVESSLDGRILSSDDPGTRFSPAN